MSAQRLAKLTGVARHEVAVVLGSGWAPAADLLGSTLAEVPVSELGGFPVSTVPGHAGTVRSVVLGASAGGPRSAADPGAPAAAPPATAPPAATASATTPHEPATTPHAPAEPATTPRAPAEPATTPRTPATTPGTPATGSRGQAMRVLVFLGRAHLYEGHSPQTVVHGVRTAVAAGCRVVVLTNAAGGIREGLRVGQPVLIRDHLNLTGRSPLAGPPPPAGLPPRFADLTDLYSARLRALARAAAPELAEGVYAALPGPHYETPAEIAMLRTLGADLVGMSTAMEAIAARHLGAEVLAISLVTNLAAGLAGHGLDHAEVVAAGAAAAGRMGSLLGSLLPRVLPA